MTNSKLDSTFISNLIETNNLVNVYLTSGIKLCGKITKEDDDCILLTTDKDSKNTQLVYKRTIATLKPA